MEYRRLGKSGLQVSVLSLGSWITFGNQIDEKMAEDLMCLAYEKGVNFFDNAEVYGNGESERVMGRILKKLNWDRSSYLVSSKAFFGRGDKRPNMTGLSRKHLIEACNEALIRMQLDYIDLFFAHRADKNTPMVETVLAMNHLLQQGKILYWGTSEWSAQEITEAHMVAKENLLVGPTMEQPQYNMLFRQKMESEFHHIFTSIGLGTTIWSPLASGLLTDKYIDGQIPVDARLNRAELKWIKEKNINPENISKVRSLSLLAHKRNTTLAKLAIAWCVQNPNVSTVILGATNTNQLQENLSALEILPVLDEKTNAEIEAILDNKPQLPVF